MHAAMVPETSTSSSSGQCSVSRSDWKKPSASRSCAARSAVRQRPARQRCRPHPPSRMSRATVPSARGSGWGSGSGPSRGRAWPDGSILEAAGVTSC